jgi:alkylation response protein AidB-like acyl-CoA dehydrogenase
MRDQIREQIRAFIQDNAPPELLGTRKGRFDGPWGGRSASFGSDAQKRWYRACLDAGYTAPSWPTEFGGGGLSQVQSRVFEQELVRAEMPPPLVGFGLTMIGPTLLDYGNDAQKRQHIPAIVRGEIRWCQGYSEPGAGSDLANLSARAERDGDFLVVSGRKVWTSHADKADWIFALVRTTPRSAGLNKRTGISFVLIDMKTAGVSVRPIKLISGNSPFCETVFDDVRVPLSNVVGQLDDGWTIAKALLGYERTMIGEAMGGVILGMESSLVALARSKSALSAHKRGQIAALSIRGVALQATLENVVAAMQSGRAPGSEASIIKIASSELKQRRWELAAELDGGTDPEIRENWLRSRANTIEGGTTEIQLNILARRVLGLPRGGYHVAVDHGGEELNAVAEMARRFCEERSPIARHRQFVGSAPTDGVWQEAEELGLTAAEALGHEALSIVLQEAGRVLMPDDWLSHLGSSDENTALIGASSLLLGAAERAFEMTLSYLREREQFDVPIGSFQALQHRAARMFVELQLTRSMVQVAARAPTRRHAHAAKHLAGATARKVANEAVQMHGGIGVTDEHDIGLFLKQIFAWDHALGDAGEHVSLFAEQGGY